MPARCRGCSLRSALTSRQDLEQLRIRAEDGCGLVIQNLLVGLQSPQQFVQFRIPGICLAVNARGFGVALALGGLGLLVSHGENLFALAVGVGADAEGLLFTLGAILAGDALAL